MEERKKEKREQREREKNTKDQKESKEERQDTFVHGMNTSSKKKARRYAFSLSPTTHPLHINCTNVCNNIHDTSCTNALFLCLGRQEAEEVVQEKKKYVSFRATELKEREKERQSKERAIVPSHAHSMHASFTRRHTRRLYVRRAHASSGC